MLEDNLREIAVFTEDAKVLIKSLLTPPYIGIYDFDDLSKKWIERKTSIILESMPIAIDLHPRGISLHIICKHTVHGYLLIGGEFVEVTRRYSNS